LTGSRRSIPEQDRRESWLHIGIALRALAGATARQTGNLRQPDGAPPFRRHGKSASRERLPGSVGNWFVKQVKGGRGGARRAVVKKPSARDESERMIRGSFAVRDWRRRRDVLCGRRSAANFANRRDARRYAGLERGRLSQAAACNREQGIRQGWQSSSASAHRGACLVLVAVSCRTARWRNGFRARWAGP